MCAHNGTGEHPKPKAPQTKTSSSPNHCTPHRWPVAALGDARHCSLVQRGPIRSTLVPHCTGNPQAPQSSPSGRAVDQCTPIFGGSGSGSSRSRDRSAGMRRQCASAETRSVRVVVWHATAALEPSGAHTPTRSSGGITNHHITHF